MNFYVAPHNLLVVFRRTNQETLQLLKYRMGIPRLLYNCGVSTLGSLSFCTFVCTERTEEVIHTENRQTGLNWLIKC